VKVHNLRKGTFNVACYFVERLCGGQEEGGWWYNQYERRGRVHTYATLDEALAVCARYRDMADEFFVENKRCIESVLSAGRYTACLYENEEPPLFDPERKPHYE